MTGDYKTIIYEVDKARAKSIPYFVFPGEPLEAEGCTEHATSTSASKPSALTTKLTVGLHVPFRIKSPSPSARARIALLRRAR